MAKYSDYVFPSFPAHTRANEGRFGSQEQCSNCITDQQLSMMLIDDLAESGEHFMGYESLLACNQIPDVENHHHYQLQQQQPLEDPMFWCRQRENQSPSQWSQQSSNTANNKPICYSYAKQQHSLSQHQMLSQYNAFNGSNGGGSGGLSAPSSQTLSSHLSMSGSQISSCSLSSQTMEIVRRVRELQSDLSSESTIREVAQNQNDDNIVIGGAHQANAQAQQELGNNKHTPRRKDNHHNNYGSGDRTEDCENLNNLKLAKNDNNNKNRGYNSDDLLVYQFVDCDDCEIMDKDSKSMTHDGSAVESYSRQYNQRIKLNCHNSNNNKTTTTANDKGKQKFSRQMSATQTTAPKRRKSRAQLLKLEAVFRRLDNPNREQRLRLAKSIGLVPDQIRLWFKNKRDKLSREMGGLEGARHIEASMSE